MPGPSGGLRFTKHENKRSTESLVVQIVRVSGPSPPPGCKQFRAGFCTEDSQILGGGKLTSQQTNSREERTLWVVSISKRVLFCVSNSKDVITNKVEEHNDYCPLRAEHDGVKDEIAGLEAVGKRKPCKTANRMHEPKSVGGYVNLGKYTGLQNRRKWK
jgi:hypothetical protein